MGENGSWCQGKSITYHSFQITALGCLVWRASEARYCRIRNISTYKLAVLYPDYAHQFTTHPFLFYFLQVYCYRAIVFVLFNCLWWRVGNGHSGLPNRTDACGPRCEASASFSTPVRLS